tara:strand:- start:1718 stop:2107 length:390 start_codon:yes stop_codon:yes gene_type:complete
MKHPKGDYLEMLKKIGVTEEEMTEITHNCKVIKFPNDSVKRKKSKIHGYGMFAKVNIKSGEIIGLASINALHKTYIGRYTNHSSIPNVEFLYLDNYDTIALAKRKIKKGEELLVDYSNHLLNPKFYILK